MTSRSASPPHKGNKRKHNNKIYTLYIQYKYKESCYTEYKCGSTLTHCHYKRKETGWPHPPTTERNTRKYSDLGPPTVCQNTAEERGGGRRSWKRWVSAGMKPVGSPMTETDGDFSSPNAPRRTDGPTSILCLSGDVRRMQFAILDRSPREMSQTDCIHLRYFFYHEFASQFGAEFFLYAKKPQTTLARRPARRSRSPLCGR